MSEAVNNWAVYENMRRKSVSPATAGEAKYESMPFEFFTRGRRPFARDASGTSADPGYFSFTPTMTALGVPHSDRSAGLAVAADHGDHLRGRRCGGRRSGVLGRCRIGRDRLAAGTPSATDRREKHGDAWRSAGDGHAAPSQIPAPLSIVAIAASWLAASATSQPMKALTWGRRPLAFGWTTE